MQKAAKINWSGLKDRGLHALIFGAASGIGAATVAGVRKAHQSLTKNRDYENMLANAPALRKENPVKVRMAFNTFHRLAPSLAKDPLVSSTFVRRTLNTDIGGGGMAVDPATAKMLVSTHSPVAVNPAQEAARTMSTSLARTKMGETTKK